MLIDIPSVAAVCPHCGRTEQVDIPETAPSLPYWTVCAGDHGCGAGYQIVAISVGALYEPGAPEPILSVRTETGV